MFGPPVPCPFAGKCDIVALTKGGQQDDNAMIIHDIS